MNNKQSIIDILSKNKLNEGFFKKISDDYKNAAASVNNSINALIKSIELLNEESKAYKKMLECAVTQSNTEINTFLKTAGIPYEFNIELVGFDDATTKLNPLGNEQYDLDDVRSHLSYGEKNALSVALFGALAKSSYLLQLLAQKHA